MPSVLVAVGTDHHPFVRVMGWIAAWTEPEVEWVVQHGYSVPPPNASAAMSLFDQPTLSAHLHRARAVVCHGGPGLIMDAVHAGHRPVVVPRDPERGEHVDGHQVAFVSWLRDRSDIRVATDEKSFRRCLLAALTDGPRPPQASGGTDVARRFGTLVDELVYGR